MAFHSLLWRCVAKRLTQLFGSHCNCSSKGRMYKLQKQERLLNAVEMGDIFEVQTCLDSGAGINDVPWGTESLLMRAIRCKHKEVAKFLINKGIDVNYVYVKSDSPRSETKNFRQETAREYAEFYDMPEIIELIDARRIRLQATP